MENIFIATIGVISIMRMMSVNGDFLILGRRGNKVNIMILSIKSY